MGDLAREVVTGFKGIVTAHTRHLTGCDTVWLTSQTEVENGVAVERCFDVLRVECVETNPLDVTGFPDDEAASG